MPRKNRFASDNITQPARSNAGGLSLRHASALASQSLIHDIETNPGPQSKATRKPMQRAPPTRPGPPKGFIHQTQKWNEMEPLITAFTCALLGSRAAGMWLAPSEGKKTTPQTPVPFPHPAKCPQGKPPPHPKHAEETA